MLLRDAGAVSSTANITEILSFPLFLVYYFPLRKNTCEKYPYQFYTTAPSYRTRHQSAALKHSNPELLPVLMNKSGVLLLVGFRSTSCKVHFIAQL